MYLFGWVKFIHVHLLFVLPLVKNEKGIFSLFPYMSISVERVKHETTPHHFMSLFPIHCTFTYHILTVTWSDLRFPNRCKSQWFSLQRGDLLESYLPNISIKCVYFSHVMFHTYPLSSILFQKIKLFMNFNSSSSKYVCVH
jgi:hypothetical protein